MRTVVFACVHNAGRSQMAAAFFNAMADQGKARALSAGTQPAERVHDEVVLVMREAGLDIGGASPRLLTTQIAREADLLITMGCGESCPGVPGLRTLDWPVPDPKTRALDDIRAIRDEIHGRVARLLADEGWQSSSRA